MQQVEYVAMDECALDRIQPLWEQLRRHHRERSRYFSTSYDSQSFEARKAALLKKMIGGRMCVDLASQDGHLIGYCVSTLSGDKEGEVDSIFVEPAFRSAGVGSELMERAIGWMEENGAVKKIVSIAAGNDEVLPFYEKFGFLPRRVVLEQKEP